VRSILRPAVYGTRRFSITKSGTPDSGISTVPPSRRRGDSYFSAARARPLSGRSAAFLPRQLRQAGSQLRTEFYTRTVIGSMSMHSRNRIYQSESAGYSCQPDRGVWVRLQSTRAARRFRATYYARENQMATLSDRILWAAHVMAGNRRSYKGIFATERYFDSHPISGRPSANG
jgi:hypothetical protein